MLQIKTIYFYFSVLFIYKRDFLKLLFLCLPLLLSRCGNQGCRTAEEQYYGGIWQDSQYLTLKPVNNSVLEQETNLGFYILKNGVSQSKAGKNTWQSLRFNNGDDVIVRSGNLFSVDINGTAYLNGYNETIHLPLSNWIGLNGGSYSIPTGEMKTKTVSEAAPSLVRVERTYKQRRNEIPWSKYKRHKHNRFCPPCRRTFKRLRHRCTIFKIWWQDRFTG